jgi:hypothetical protein
VFFFFYISGEVIFERRIGDNANDVQRSTQRKRTYEEAVEEAGRLLGF